MNKLVENAIVLEQELAWFTRILDTRFKLHFGNAVVETDNVYEIGPPDLSASQTEYAQFVRHYRLSFAERLALVLSMVPHLRPQLLDGFFTRNATYDRRFTEFGGATRGGEGEFIPTGTTLVFLLAGNDLALRFGLQHLFDPQHFFTSHGVLKTSAGGAHPGGEELSTLSMPLSISDELLALFTIGQARRPGFGTAFPARQIETSLSWEDVVLQPSTRRSVEEIQTWIRHGATLMNEWGMAPKLRPGYRALFYGPPGTGKTMTACLIGKVAGREVYKVDLSMVMSKYIGETEKNLARVFDQAEHKDWILFFDEADALFGKRSETRDAHDRYANQEVAFLLQRIETFDGIAILASNLRNNVDDAFARRFESVIYFPMPRPEERLRLWQRGFSPKAVLDRGVELDKIAREYVLSGGAIMNVIRYASLQALRDGRPISTEDLMQGIQKEFAKEGKVA